MTLCELFEESRVEPAKKPIDITVDGKTYHIELDGFWMMFIERFIGFKQ